MVFRPLILSALPVDWTGTVLFYLFALVTGGSALLVVVSRNIVRMAVALLFTLAGVAGLYFLLNAEFLAAVQLVVYAGGTLILIVFGVMLTSKSPFTRFEPKMGEVVIAISISIVLLTALVMAVPGGRVEEKLDAAEAPTFLLNGKVPEPARSTVGYDAAAGVLIARGRVSAEDRQALWGQAEADAKVAGAEAPAAFGAALDRPTAQSQRLFAGHPLEPTEGYPIATLGQKLLGDYLIPFEIVSVLLLAVMIGAAYLAKGRRREEAPV